MFYNRCLHFGCVDVLHYFNTVLTNNRIINSRTKCYNYISGEANICSNFQCIMLYLSSILGVDIFPVIVSHGGYRTMIQEEGMTTIYSMYL